jgi:hypothetical protein
VNYRIRTDKSWYDTVSDLEETFRLWRVRDYQVVGKPSRKVYQSEEERTVTIRFQHPSGREIVVTKSDQERDVDNLRALYLALDDMRMMEKRGVMDIIREALLQLPAPSKHRDPFEILGVRSDAPREIIEAAYRAQAKRLHPDAGGDAEAFHELQQAWEQIRDETS